MDAGQIEIIRNWIQGLNLRCGVESGSIVFPEAGYEIRLSDCSTATQILRWVMVLTEKPWMTTDLLKFFVVVAVEEGSVDVYR